MESRRLAVREMEPGPPFDVKRTEGRHEIILRRRFVITYAPYRTY